MTTQTNKHIEQTQSEVNLKTQAFRDHVEHQLSINKLNAERDDLIAELARRVRHLDNRLQEADDALETSFPEYYTTQVGNE